jgi:glutathione synthase/RimK-type ligase-like ATP-grasp enzyme
MKVTSKLDNATLLLQNPSTSDHIPHTQLLTASTLSQLLQQFPSVYLKPNDSAQGKGILRVDYDGDEYTLRSRDTKVSSTHESFPELWEDVNQQKRNRMYVIQQGISSVTKAGKPFDIRVHLARINGSWIVGGIVGRLASKESIVTNAYSGGISKHVQHILTEDMELSPTQSLEIIHQLKSLSLHATKITSNLYPKWAEYGLDIGLDQNLHPWIYEINITPGGKVFKNLDRESFLHILRLHKQAR